MARSTRDFGGATKKLDPRRLVVRLRPDEHLVEHG
jgi:hypothetical protein